MAQIPFNVTPTPFDHQGTHLPYLVGRPFIPALPETGQSIALPVNHSHGQSTTHDVSPIAFPPGIFPCVSLPLLN